MQPLRMALALLFFTGIAQADCWQLAASRYHVDPLLLYAIAKVESGLDPRARRATWELVRQVRDAGVAVLLTTHDMTEAGELADLVHIVDRGRVQISGTVADLTADGSLEDAFLTHTSGDRA